MILSPFSWATASATTRAPATVGCPSCTASPSPTSSTRSSSTVAPTSASSSSTWSVSPGATLYCLPPVSTTAYMVLFLNRYSRPAGGAGFRAAGNEKPPLERLAAAASVEFEGGAPRFELGTSASRTLRANQAALRPVETVELYQTPPAADNYARLQTLRALSSTVAGNEIVISGRRHRCPPLAAPI